MAEHELDFGTLGAPDLLTVINPVFTQNDAGDWFYQSGAGDYTGDPNDAEALTQWMAESFAAPGQISPVPVGDVPQWALDKYGTPEGVYQHFVAYGDTSPEGLELRQTQWEYEANDAALLEEALAGHAAGLESVGGVITGLEDFLASIQDDPTRQFVEDELTRRTQDDYSLIGGSTLSAIEQQLGVGITRAQAMQQNALNAAGWGRSGLSASNPAEFAAIGSAGLAQLYGSTATANQQARGDAVNALGAFNLDYDQLETGIQGLLGDAGLYEAGFEAGVPLSGFDPWLGFSVNYASEQDALQQQNLDEQLATLNQESQPNLWDLATLIPSLVGTGIFR